MLSGHGKGSFRGKVYNVFIKHFTDYSLYSNLSNEGVTEIADALEDVEWSDLETVDVDPDTVSRKEVPESFQDGYHGFRSREEFEDFKTMFRRYADIGAELEAWY